MNIGLDSESLKTLDRSHHLHPFTDLQGYARQGGRVFSRAENVFIHDTDGNVMLDAMSGLWCCNLGYSQQRIKDAITRQLADLPYYNNFFPMLQPTGHRIGRCPCRRGAGGV